MYAGVLNLWAASVPSALRLILRLTGREWAGVGGSGRATAESVGTVPNT